MTGKKTYLVENWRREVRFFVSLSFAGDQPGDHILSTFSER